VLVESRGRGVYQDFVLGRIVAEHSRGSSGIGGRVAIELTSVVDEKISRFGGMVGGPETDGACEMQSSLVLIGVVFLLGSVTLTLCRVRALACQAE
jgi:hypothetical protein